MSKHKIFNNLIGALAVVALPTATLSYVSSCSNQQDKPANLEVPEYTVNHLILVTANFSAQPKSSIYVELYGEDIPPELQIAERAFPVVESKASIAILIDESLIVTKNFNYQLKVRYVNNHGAETTYIFDECQTTFIYSEPEKEEDEVYPTATIIQRYNNHDFDFRLRYNPKQQETKPEPGTKFVLEMYDYDQELSFLGSPEPHRFECPLSAEGQRYYLNFIVHLDQGIYSTDNYPFSLKITFTNSFGKQQIVDIKDLIISFVEARDKVLPQEYFTFEEDPENANNGILTGVSDEVPESEWGKYTVIKIPEIAQIPDGQGGKKTINITSIGPSAFDKKVVYEGEQHQWFINIHKVIFNSQIEVLDETAFNGCENLYYIDISAFVPESWLADQILPKWIPDEKGEVVAPFAKSKYKTGYFVVHKFEDPEEDENYRRAVSIRIINISLNYDRYNEMYKVCNSEQISSEELFELDSDGTEILGLRENVKQETLEKCKVIEIPDYVTSLSDFCLTQFGKVPYKNPSTQQYETRRIIFHNGISNVGCQHNVGLGGPIVFNMNELESFPDNCFQDVNSYAWSVTQPIESERPYILFHDCDKLTSIGKSVFIDVPLTQDDYAIDTKFTLPKNITSIGDYAFRGNQYSSITIPETITSIGLRAFSQPDPSGKGNLKEVWFNAFKDDKLLDIIPENQAIFEYSLAPSGFIYLDASSDDYEQEIRERLEQNGFTRIGTGWQIRYAI